MLSIVEARTSQGDLLSLPLDDISDGLVLQAVEGLDPVKATLVSSSFARLDGEQYQSSRREARNVHIKLELQGNAQELRKKLYNYFMPKSEVELTFRHTDGLIVEIVGRVESFESVLFTKDPEVDISIMCFDPDFVDPVVVRKSGSTTALSIETLVRYAGSVETGVVFTLKVNRSVADINFYHRSADGTLRSMDFSNPLLAGDVLEISTIPGKKGAWRTRAGTKTSVLYGISPQSYWLELQPGDNQLRIYATGASIPYTLEYTTKYGGL